MINTEETKTYSAPRVKTVEISSLGLICQSGGINNMAIDPDGGDDFE